MSDFVWPSDADRAENDELNRVCEELEAAFDQLEAARAQSGQGSEAIGQICDDGEGAYVELYDDYSFLIGQPVYVQPQPAQQGSVSEVSDIEKLRCQQCGNMEPFHATGCETEYGNYAPTTPQADGWVRCDERLPTEADADIFGNVWCSGFWDDPNRGIAPINWSNVGKGFAGDTHWKPTGLKRPQPPKEGE